MRVKRCCLTTLCAGACLLLVGCGTPMQGSPSLSLMSRSLNASSPQIKVIGNEVVESDTMTWFLLAGFFGNFMQSHEAALSRLLEQQHAELLVDAEMDVSAYGIPYLYMQFNATVRGRPAVFVKGGAK